MPGLIQPSWKQGFARSAGESAFPGLWKGLVCMLLPALGQSGGTVFDISNRGNNASIAGATWTTGNGWRVLDFDGSNDTLSVPDNDLLDLTTQRTIAVWAKADSLTTGAEENRLVLKSNSTGGHSSNLYTLDIKDGNLIFQNNNEGASFCTGATTIQTGRWYFLVGTYDLVEQRVFVDGIEDGNLARTDTGTANSGAVIIGGRTNGSDMLDGQMGQITLWDRALFFNEIKFLFANPLAIVQLRQPIWKAPAAVGGADVRNHIIPAYMRVNA